MQTVNRRNAKDAILQETKALPAAGASATSDLIYIGGEGPHREGLKVRVDLPVNAVLVATKDLDMALVDSADGSSSAAVSPGQTYQIIGDTGFAATSFYFDVPQTARDYVGVSFTVEAAGGDNTGTTATVSLVK
mgnify:CR=1 FL=1|jgi:hypothetical protein